MTFRADISINWAVSPRIITVASPSTEVSIQDLVDTLRQLEDDLNNLDDKKILDAAGKTQIGTGKYTSITAVLRNALLAFAARTGPSWVLCMVTGGNLVAKDANGVILPSAMQPTAYVYPIVALSTDGSLLAGSGATPAEVADAVWDEPAADHVAPGSEGRSLEDTADFVDDLHDESFGRWVLNPSTSTWTLYRKNGTVMQVFNMKVAVGDVPPYVERTPVP